MKKMKLILGLTVAALLTFASCEKSETLSVKSVAGTYKGTLISQTGLKSTADGSFDATMDVSDAGNGQIEVHCYGGDIDTTFMLDYYLNGDSTMVCFTGEAFEEMYGHMKENMDNNMGTGSMMGSGDMMSGQSWMDHMSSEHEAGDEHFGGFDMTNNSFDYIMQTGTEELRFQGKKTE